MKTVVMAVQRSTDGVANTGGGGGGRGGAIGP